jgi:PTH1 family peptidyl-tRNA hydrolase
MHILLGIGNPGNSYTETPHNVGFHLLDALSSSGWKKQGKAHIQKCVIRQSSYIFVKPTTYVNLSGEAALASMSYYKIPPENLIVVVDDVNLPFGAIRIRKDGSAGGHNGLKSIIKHCGQSFPRIRIGIGHCPPEWELSNWVLRKMNAQEVDDIHSIADILPSILETGTSEGWEAAAGKFNRKGSLD